MPARHGQVRRRRVLTVLTQSGQLPIEGKTAVKARNLLILVAVTAVVLACAGGKSRQVTPGHLSTGMRQIIEGNRWYQRGCYHRSLEHYLRANAKFSISDQIDGVAISLNNIGNVYRILGDYPSAVLYMDGAYRIYQALQDSPSMVRTLTNKAAAFLAQGALMEAEPIIDQATRIALASGAIHYPLDRNRAILLAGRGEYPVAQSLLTGLLTSVDPDDWPEIAATNVAMANLLMDTDRHREAIDFLRAALSADREAGFHTGIADDLSAMGAAYQQLGDDRSAANYYQRCLKIYALTGNQQKVSHTLDRLEEISETEDIDLSITKHFVERWLAGETEGLCE